METKYKILYTHQKLKKRKTWQDGFLQVGANRKAILSNDDGKTIDSLFVKDDQLYDGGDMESDKYLIQIEGIAPSNNNNAEILRQQQGNVEDNIKKNSAVQQSVFKSKPFRPVFANHKKRPVDVVEQQPSSSFVTNPCYVLSKSMNASSFTASQQPNLFSTSGGGVNNTSVAVRKRKDYHVPTYTHNNDTDACRNKTISVKRSSDDILALFATQNESQNENRDGEDGCSSGVKIELRDQDGFLHDGDNKSKPCSVYPSKWMKFDITDTSSAFRYTHKVEYIQDDKCTNLNNSLISSDLISNIAALSDVETPANNNVSEVDKCFIEESTMGCENVVKSSESIKATRVITIKPTTAKNTRISRFMAPSSNMSGSLVFPLMKDSLNKATPQRRVVIPFEFNSVREYKQTFSHALIEHLNILLFNLAVKCYESLKKVDLSNFSGKLTDYSCANDNTPKCKHGITTTLKSVRKDGQNKGRLFFSCSHSNDKSCNYFVWMDEVSTKSSIKNNQSNTKVSNVKPKFTDPKNVNTFFSSQHIELYCCCKIIRKSAFQRFPTGRRKGASYSVSSNKKPLYVVLPFKKSSTFYAKGDIWLISKNFDFNEMFIAKSVFFGPNQSCELEIEPLCSYSPSNWSDGSMCHSIQAFNASSELTCMNNLDKYVNPMDMPVLRSLMTAKCSVPQFLCQLNISCLEAADINELVSNAQSAYQLNEGQGKAMKKITSMFEIGSLNAVTLVHGVFGAGKSYLLSTVVIVLVQLFELIEAKYGSYKLKLLIASTTNVAVDRVLLGLLELGFGEFVRVGSVKKIAKPILPFSVHASDHEDQELKELNELTRSELSETEKGYVRKAIDQHKLGVNRKRLSKVRVVGITCAATDFPYLDKLQFHVQLLDECSQMTEPLSLLPIARFKCEKLVLVGDPKQLAPTIQGSEAEHANNLELTLFERLQKMDMEPAMLCTQYRCHPIISSICNKLFYHGVLLNGITPQQRQPLVESLPTLSFVNIGNGLEKCEADGSYSNFQEADFVVHLLVDILARDVEPSQLGVITQYRSQVQRISTIFREKSSLNITAKLNSLQVSTVDAFQGAEKEIILLSCVRTRHIGFIACPRRTNVALSRAKRHLIIAGNFNLLKHDAIWGGVINICRENNGLFMNSEQFINKLTGTQVCGKC